LWAMSMTTTRHGHVMKVTTLALVLRNPVRLCDTGTKLE
jgi:hypothetical protein